MSRDLRYRSRSRSRHQHQHQGRYSEVNNAVNNSNRFAKLNNNVNEHEVINSSDKTRTSVNANTKASNMISKSSTTTEDPLTKQRIPPLKVTNKSLTQIRSAIMSIKNIKIVQNMFRPTQFGNYIYAQSVADYKTIRNFCDINDFKYVTHALNEEVIERFCLYGLEQMPHEELKAELAKVCIDPVQVTEIPIKKKRYAEHCIYVLHFMRKQKIQLDLLQQVTGLFHTRVKFAVYDDPNKFEPKQCKRCQDYNHGERGCTQDYKCRRCAGSHSSSECEHLPYLENNDDQDPEVLADGTHRSKIRDHTAKIDSKLLKCANCGGNHTSSYKGCIKRLEMKQLREVIHNKRAVSRQQIPNINDFSQFNALPPPGRPIGNNSWQQTAPGPSYASYKRSPPREQFYRSHQTYEDQYYHPSPNASQSNDLFTYDECSDIMDEFLEKLLTCRNKFDQLRVIREITFKFIYSHNAHTK